MFFTMLTEYVEAAMARAKYKLLDEHEGFFGEIPGFKGVWANARTLAHAETSCKRCLRAGYF